jgi:hypothetical protein
MKNAFKILIGLLVFGLAVVGTVSATTQIITANQVGLGNNQYATNYNNGGEYSTQIVGVSQAGSYNNQGVTNTNNGGYNTGVFQTVYGIQGENSITDLYTPTTSGSTQNLENYNTGTLSDPSNIGSQTIIASQDGIGSTQDASNSNSFSTTTDYFVQDIGTASGSTITYGAVQSGNYLNEIIYNTNI